MSLVEPSELLPTDEPFHRQADLRADVGGCALVVAGEHLELDPEPLQPRDRFGGILLRRIREDEEAEQLEPLLVVVAVARLRSRSALGEGEHSMTVVEQTGERRIDLLADARERLDAVRQANRRAAGKHFLGSSLAEQHACVRRSPSSTTDVRRRSNVNGRVATRSTRASSASATCGSRLRQIARSSVLPSGVAAVLEVELAAEQPWRFRSRTTAPVGPTASR